jgi:hypothetical protein
MDYSSPYQLVKDDLKLYTYDKMIHNLTQTVFHKNKEKMTHIGQYHVWKRSIRFRFYLEAIYSLVMTILF